MKSLMIVICLMLGAAEGRAGDSLFYYSDMEGHYYPVDTTRILVRWREKVDSIGLAEFLTDYPNIKEGRTDTAEAEDYLIHYFDGAYEYKTIMSQLMLDTNVIAISNAFFLREGVSVYFGDRIVCRFESEVSTSYIDSVFAAHGLEIARISEFVPLQYTIKVTSKSDMTTIDMANYLHELPTTKWSHPCRWGDLSLHGYSVRDSLFQIGQWNIQKTIGFKDTSNYGAWELTRGILLPISA